MAEKFDPPLEMDLGDNPRKITFRSVGEALAWAEAEQETWSKFGPANPNELGIFLGPSVAAQRGIAGQVVASLNTALDDVRPTIDPADVINNLKPYEGAKSVHSESAVGQLILSAMDDANTLPEMQRIAGVLAAAIGQPAPINEIRNGRFPETIFAPMLAGAALYQFWRGPTPKWAEAERSAMSAALGEWTNKLSVHEKKHNEATKKIAELEALIEKMHEAQRTDYTEQKMEIQTEFSELKQFYEEKVRTEAPTTYWSAKATKHGRSAKWFQAWFLVIAIGASISAYQIGATFLSGNDTATTLNSVLARLGLFIAPGFFIVWILRIILRLGLSHEVIADDAEHRVTMVETFMSLLEHEEKMEPADRILMLQALFRPTPTRGGDDDAAPPNWFDLLMQRVKPK